MHTEPASRSSASQVLEAHGRAAPHLSSPLATPCLSSVFMPSLTPLLCYFFPLSGLITPLLSCNVFSCVSFLVGLVPPRLLCSPSLEASLLPPLGTPIPSAPQPPLPALPHTFLVFPTPAHPALHHPTSPSHPPFFLLPSRYSQSSLSRPPSGHTSPVHTRPYIPA